MLQKRHFGPSPMTSGFPSRADPFRGGLHVSKSQQATFVSEHDDHQGKVTLPPVPGGHLERRRRLFLPALR